MSQHFPHFSDTIFIKTFQKLQKFVSFMAFLGFCFPGLFIDYDTFCVVSQVIIIKNIVSFNLNFSEQYKV